MKYILETWINGDFISRFLRPITRENNKYLISDVQRTVKDWKAKEHEYVFIYKWAQKYVKDSTNPLGFRRSIGRLDNTDGVMSYQVTEDPSILKCPYTYDEVFGNDLRDIQDPFDNPLRTATHFNTSFNLDRWMIIPERKDNIVPTGNEFRDSIEIWDNKLVMYIKDLFKVPAVYYLFDEIQEHKKRTILTNSMTLFHINIFRGIENKSIPDNYYNRTIGYWLFDDKLVFQYEDGKNTW